MQEIREEKVKMLFCQQAFNGGTKMRKPTLRKKVWQGTELVSEDLFVEPGRVLFCLLPEYRRIALEQPLHLSNGLCIGDWIGKRDRMNRCALREARKDIQRTHFSAGIGWVERLPQCEQYLHKVVQPWEGRSVSDDMARSGS